MTASDQQTEGIVQARQDLVRCQNPRPRGGQFYGEGQAVETDADGSHRLANLRRQCKPGLNGSRSFHEQPHSGVLLQLLRGNYHERIRC